MAALEERGIAPSEGMREPPELRAEDQIYWTAFLDLCSTRNIAGGPIPWTAIDAYSRRYGLDIEELKHLIWKLDQTLREAVKND